MQNVKSISNRISRELPSISFFSQFRGWCFANFSWDFFRHIGTFFMRHRYAHLTGCFHGDFFGYLVAMGYLDIMAHSFVDRLENIHTMGFGNLFTMGYWHFFGCFDWNFSTNFLGDYFAMTAITIVRFGSVVRIGLGLSLSFTSPSSAITIWMIPTKVWRIVGVGMVFRSNRFCTNLYLKR